MSCFWLLFFKDRLQNAFNVEFLCLLISCGGETFDSTAKATFNVVGRLICTRLCTDIKKSVHKSKGVHFQSVRNSLVKLVPRWICYRLDGLILFLCLSVHHSRWNKMYTFPLRSISILSLIRRRCLASLTYSLSLPPLLPILVCVLSCVCVVFVLSLCCLCVVHFFFYLCLVLLCLVLLCLVLLCLVLLLLASCSL